MARRRSPWGTRRRSTKADAQAIAALVTAIVVVATAGVYLIVAIVRAVSDASRSSAKSQRVARTGRASADTALPSIESDVGAPPEIYREVITVDPGATTNADFEREAERAFVSWARRLPRAPRDASDRIQLVTSRARQVGRLATRLEGRRFTWRSAASVGRDASTQPRVDIATLDPWHPPSDLRAQTQHTTSCSRCVGDGRVACGRCTGSARVGCTECDGSGKYQGYDARGARRVLNCKVCRGKGSATCDNCTRGRVMCTTCDGTKRLSVWLEVDSSARVDIQVEPDGDVTRAFKWGKDGVSASEHEIAADAATLCSLERPRLIRRDELPREVAEDWRDMNWNGIQAHVRNGERVMAQHFSLLDLKAVDVTYAVGDAQDTIAFEGRRLLAPPASFDTLFARRAQTLNWAMIGLALLPLVMGIIYLARGAWFMSPEIAIAIASTALLSGLVYVSLWRATLPRRGALAWLGGTVAPLVAAIVFAVRAEPDVERVREAVAMGELDAADREIEALAEGERDGVAKDLNLARVFASRSGDEAAELLAKLPSPPATARAHVDGLFFAAATLALSDHQLDRASERFAKISATAAAEPAAKALGERIHAAIDDDILSSAARALELGNLDAADAALARADESLRARASWLEAAVDAAIKRGRRELANAHFSEALALAQRAADFGTIGTAPASSLRSDVLAALTAHAETTTAAAKSEKDLDKRLALENTAESAWVELTKAVPETRPTALDALRKRIVLDAQAFTRRAAEATRLQAIAQRREADRIAAAERREAQRAAAAERALQLEAARGAASYRSYGGKVCNRGCPCGNSCISCSKRCRH